MNKKLGVLSIVFGIISISLPLTLLIEFYSGTPLFLGNTVFRFIYLVCSTNNFCTKSFLMLFFILLPLIFGIIGIIIGGKSQNQEKSKINILGIILSTIGILLSLPFLISTILYGGI